jgi:acyl dehydratase
MMVSRGYILPEWRSAPLTQEAINAYAKASGDDNPLHTDLAAARAAGLENTIVHGMMLLGLVGEAVEAALTDHRILSLGAKFLTPIKAGERVVVTGKAVADKRGPAADQAVLRLFVAGETGAVALMGEAHVAPRSA